MAIKTSTQSMFLPRFVAVLLFVIPGAGFEPATVQAEGCTEPSWTEGGVYLRGDVVTHKVHEWQAKRASQEVEPGTHKPTWRDLGVCDTELPPPPPPPPPGGSTPMQIFGIWHAGNHYADWALPRDFGDPDDLDDSGEFGWANNWIIDRGDGFPSVNLVVLSFLHPMQVLNMTAPENGVPVGMTQEVVDYFKDAGIRVMMSIGGVTYTDAWDEALSTDESAWDLGINAAEIAAKFGVGIEIDYERNTSPNIVGLQTFIDAYRSMHLYDAKGANHAARLTIDLAAGGRYLQTLNRYATINWLDNASPVLDYANAMVHRRSGSPDNWQEHVTGMPTYDPVIPPKAPNRFTGGLYLKGNMANCTDFYSSEQWQHSSYVQTVAPAGAGITSGMLGFMFWAAEYPSARKNYVATVPPNECQDGMGQAVTEFEFLVPMEALRQDKAITN